MPQTFDLNTTYLKSRVRLAGLRACFLFKWLPYITYNKPKIKVSVSTKSPEFKIQSVSIDCDDPRAKNTDLSPNYYGWYAKDLSKEGVYSIVLPPLISARVQYEYSLSVRLKYPYKEGEQELTTGGLIMTTGDVLSLENTAMVIVSAIIGSALTLLIQFIVTRF